MAITEVFAGIPVTDYASAGAWYERLFGRPPDMLPHDHEAVWELAGSGWVYVVEDPERAGRGLLTLLVDDLDRQIEELASRGLETEPVETLSNGVRKAAITDADGNRISFGGAPS
jgi:catechol 2,3-dioxygenase-like lactoylglutathione lyase family enzyme